MSEITFYVTYFIAEKQKISREERSGDNLTTLFPGNLDERIPGSQRDAVNTYLESQLNQTDVLTSFIETPDNKKTNKWPELGKAVQVCKEKNATLVIAELSTLTNNEAFTELLLNSGVSFHCCDQPFINQTILEALYKHAQVQRKKHGELIREGLKLTSAKSGNPNAAEVISKVNKPKIDTAIVFAFLLQPIIADYRKKGYSQRQMVKTLNEEGFTAPEGGKWVLSQLQKVLDRVRVNEVALDLQEQIEELLAKNATDTEIAEEFNSKGVQAIKRGAWNETQVNKVVARLEQIKEIKLINKFVINLLPILHECKEQNLDTTQILDKFDTAGLKVRQTVAAA